MLVQTYLSPGQECLRSIVQQAIANSKEVKEIISPFKVHYFADKVILLIYRVVFSVK